MNKLEAYIPVPSIQIKGFTHSEIQGVEASIKESPFKDGHISQFSVVGIENETEVYETTEQNVLRKISEAHGRSYEFVTGKNNTLIWCDRFGNPFTTLTTKGNNCSSLGVYADSSAPSGFTLEGLQDSNAIVRVLKASEILRSKNIDTEVIIKVIEPAELPYKDERISLEEFKKKLLESVWAENAPENTEADHNWKKVTREQIPTLSKALHDMTLFITVRAHQSPERLRDLVTTSKGIDPFFMLARALQFTNLNETLKTTQGKQKSPQHFSHDSEENLLDSIEFYLAEYFPKKLAINIATMHKSGLVHRFLHSGNISLSAGIYDLDSVRGEPLGLGDPEITEADMIYDVKQLIDGHANWFSPKQVLDSFGINRSERFDINFFKQYFREMGWEGDISRLTYIHEMLGLTMPEIEGHPDNQERKELFDYYSQLVIASNHLYSLNNPSQIVSFFAGDFLRLFENFDEVKKDEIFSLFFLVLKEKIDESLIGNKEAVDESTQEGIALLSYILAKKINIAFEEALNNEKTVNEILSGILNSEQSDTRDFLQFELDFQKRVVKHLGWEGDILEYIEDIDNFFDGFLEIEACPYINYYAEKLEEQLGFKFVVTESSEDLISLFHLHDNQEAKRDIETALAKADGTISKEQIVENALKEGNFTWDHKGAYTEFVIEHLRLKLDEDFKDNLEQLYEKYGDDKAYVISNWLIHKYEDAFINNLPDEINLRIEKEGQARIEQLRREYLSNVS